jgi:outer membrane lipoprotein-sorting protein
MFGPNTLIKGGLLATLLLSSGIIQAGETPGDTVVQKLDKTLAKMTDQEMYYDLVITKPGNERTIKFKVSIKGRKRRIDFLAPGDVKGIRFLTLSHNQMYAFVPSQRKVRRLASHILAMGFMGSTFSHNEMALVSYGELYTGELKHQDDRQWTVVLNRRPGVDAAYPKLEMKISKKYQLPLQIDYFNDKGVKLKTEVRTEYQCSKGICYPAKFTMTDQVDPRNVSKLVGSKWKVNAGLKDRLFTVRSLERK